MKLGLLKRIAGTPAQHKALAIAMIAARILRMRQFDKHTPCWQR